MTTKPKTRKASATKSAANEEERGLTMTKTALAQAIERHKAAQMAIDAHSRQIDDGALAQQLFAAENGTLELLAETPCANNAEFIEKLRYLLAHEARISNGPPDGSLVFGSILVAVDRHFNPGRGYTDHWDNA
ncbi:MAG: hypothetical protein WCB09_09665 [Methylocella sp.]